MKNRGCVADAFLERFWDAQERLLQVSPVHFGSHFRPKIEKWHPKRHPKIDAEKVLKIDAKMIPKWCRNGCQNQWFFIPFRKRRKATKLFKNQSNFRFSACKKVSKINPKSMQNRCKKKACKIYCRRGASPPHPLDTSRWKQIDQRLEIGRYWRHRRKKRRPKTCQNH